MSLTSAEVDIVNRALDKLGTTIITFAAQTGGVALKCNRIFVPTRDELNRDYEWTFAIQRVTLTAETATPDFDFDFKCKLPKDYLRMKDKGYDDSDKIEHRPKIESGYLLTNESTKNIIYIRKVTNPAEFDVLFTRVLVLRLAKKLRNPIAGTKTLALYETLDKDLEKAESKASLVNLQEDNVSGRSDHNQARNTSIAGHVVITGEERS